MSLEKTPVSANDGNSPVVRSCERSNRWSIAAERALNMSQSIEEEQEVAANNASIGNQNPINEARHLNVRRRSSQKLLEDIHHSKSIHIRFNLNLKLILTKCRKIG